ncbi:TetR/AcrR family transcriptional regulator [Kitasatospora sp. DSM 101779]|uniref:TetR/AcrR family transcriptional regulator n=1 Tax=Kitasatospora sp. DSM 101779 TaxID=2853165 RepID=UPI0021D89FDA|nr:TetR/AcrR family transcriptional regulator [Kitasatospora sp. DSM 101779]MCU7823583.1 TetR/AcrR family transcriptional regulator [Kitasatospora sp. DSM 101779]MCU7827394.1 TetR/AcrR family transcriptional regulator [Kitasatospora sp. DSM 101779]
MAAQQRRERERAERHRLIITAARELAEAEGWGAVTTRRLSERVEYSQPVLYSHFKGKDAIVAAVAVEGFEELATALRRARADHPDARAGLRALAYGYLEFARARPAVYAAMFVRETDIEFGTEATPAPLKAAFGELHGAVAPLAAARGADPEACTELFWSALHGLATLTEGSRLRPGAHRTRVDLLIDLVTAGT